MVKNSVLFQEVTTGVQFVKLFLRVLSFLHSGSKFDSTARDNIHIRFDANGIDAKPTWMLLPVSILCFFTSELMGTVVSKTKRMK